jgi:hypothetical protein
VSRGARIFGLVALLVAGWVAWRLLFPDEEARVRRVVERVATAASFTGQEGDLGRLTKAADVASYFTGDANIRVEILGGLHGSLDGRDEIRTAAMAAMSAYGNARIRAFDVIVRLDGSDRAQVNLTASMETAGGKDFTAQEFKLEFRKVDGKWLIARVESVRTLQR